MRISRLLFTAAATALLTSTFTQTPAARLLDDNDIKLSGCLVRGSDKGYFLSNGAEPSLQRTASSEVTPSAVGTSGRVATIFYWLDGDNDLKEHIGNRVEIEGDIKGDPKEGEIKIDRKDKWTEVTVKADGRKLKANVPHTSVLPAPGSDGDSKTRVLVRRVDVSKVRMLAATCEP